MSKVFYLKLSGVIYLVIDIIIQASWIFFLGNIEFITKYSLHNVFLLACFAEGIFGKSKLMGWIVFFVLLAFLVLSIYVLITFIMRKGNFLVPLISTVLNAAFHMVFYWSNPFAYVGLLYKIIGCTIFSCILLNRQSHQSGDGSVIDNG